MSVSFHKDKITFNNYRIAAASVYSNPELPARDISEVRIHLRHPPEVVTTKGEVLFIPHEECINLTLFARINNIPDVYRSDVWANLLDPFLDTETPNRIEQGILINLKNDGFGVDEISEIRDKVKKAMLKYNSVVWEWVHLGHYDLYLAMRQVGDDMYDWANGIAARGRVFERPAEDLMSTVNLKLGSLAFDIAGRAEIYQTFDAQLKELVIRHHTESGRHYHNLTHSLKVAEFCESKTRVEGENLALRLAAWFHDIIYDPEKKDNEQQSAVLMEKVISETDIDRKVVELAKDLILITKDHLSAKTRLEKIMVDADMFIFSQDQETYDGYVNAVRKEYSIYNDDDFYNGRLVFLQKLRRHIGYRGKLFHTLHPMNEDLARENIEREISAITAR